MHALQSASAKCSTTRVPGVQLQPKVAPRPLRGSTARTSALPEWLRKTFDFSSWAPKSARIWRLQEFEVPDPVEEAEKEKNNPVEQTIDELQIRANEMRQKDSNSPAYASNGPDNTLSKADDDEPQSTKTFEEADDSELAQALRARIQTMSSSSESDEEGSDNEQSSGAQIQGTQQQEEEEEEEVDPLTGEEMRELLWAKYGKLYDVSFARRDMPGKAFVCLNIMWQHLEQRSFKMTEAQYIDKVDSVAYMVNVLGQTEKVRSFLSSRARSEKGLPRRPVVGTAISIQLDLAPEIVSEFFGSGYY